MMRKLFTILLIGQLSFNYSIAQIGTICNWDNDKQAAVVLTFDDWSSDHYEIVVPELKKRNINATFFPVMWNIDSWSDLVEARSYGNEIGNHTYNHVDLTVQSAIDISNEILDAKDIIEQKVITQDVISFAYPMGEYNEQVINSLKESGHISSRSVYAPSGIYYTYDFAVQEKDYFEIRTSCVDNTITPSAILDKTQNVINGGGLLTFLYHSIDSNILQEQLETLLSVEDKVWITTLGQAIKYHREARCAELKEVTPYNGEKWVIELSDTLSDNSLYNQPLTIRLKTNGVNYTEIIQNDINIPIDNFIDDTILFKAIPDAGNITLISSNSTSIENKSEEGNYNIYPLPAKNFVNFKYHKTLDNIRVKIYSLSGNFIKSFNYRNIGLNSVSLNVEDLKRDTYLFSFQLNNKKSITKKIVLH